MMNTRHHTPFGSAEDAAMPNVAGTLLFKLNHKGWEALSDTEVVSLVLGTQARALDTAKKVMELCGNSLAELARIPASELLAIENIGEGKALALGAAMELARRKADAGLSKKPVIKSASDAFNYIKADLMDLLTEEFWVILLNRSNQVIKKVQISSGGASVTVADPKVIYKAALEYLSSGIILVHNHPSGNLQPSQADFQLTRKLADAGKVLEITVLDHLIIAGNGFYSFTEHGDL
jgi:DNA repair protein RadC